MLNALNPHLIFGIKVQILAYATYTFLPLIKPRISPKQVCPLQKQGEDSTSAYNGN